MAAKFRYGYPTTSEGMASQPKNGSANDNDAETQLELPRQNEETQADGTALRGCSHSVSTRFFCGGTLTKISHGYHVPSLWE